MESKPNKFFLRALMIAKQIRSEVLSKSKTEKISDSNNFIRESTTIKASIVKK